MISQKHSSSRRGCLGLQQEDAKTLLATHSFNLATHYLTPCYLLLYYLLLTNRLLASGSWHLATYYSLLTTYYSLLTTYYWLLASGSNYLLLAPGCSLLSCTSQQQDENAFHLRLGGYDNFHYGLGW